MLIIYEGLHFAINQWYYKFEINLVDRYKGEVIWYDSISSYSRSTFTQFLLETQEYFKN